VKNITTGLKLFSGAVLLLLGAETQAQMSGHTYTSESIETGSRVYVRNCALCHGPDGEWVEGISLARGKFRSAVTDDDLREVIALGTAAGRTPAFSLSETDLPGLISYIRTGFEPPVNPSASGTPSAERSCFRAKVIAVNAIASTAYVRVLRLT
jgi:mono/diheme cytochrome c family protein